jgi:predicted aspartyl protease
LSNFPELLRSLSLGCLSEAERLVYELQQVGRVREATVGRLIISSRRRDRQEVLRIAGSKEAELLRKDRKYHRLLALSLYWVVGMTEARDELIRLCRTAGPRDQDRECGLAEFVSEIGSEDLLVTSSHRPTDIPFFPGKQLPIILAGVNQLSPSYFIVDTGAPTSVLSETYCKRAGIGYSRAYYRSARDSSGRRLRLYFDLISEITVGRTVIRRCPLAIARFSPNLKVAGILSPFDTFRNFDVELDFKRKCLRLLDPSRAMKPTRIDRLDYASLLWDDGAPFVRAKIDNVEGLFLVDTGAGANICTPFFARLLGHSIKRREVIMSTTFSGKARVLRGFEASLQVGESCDPDTEFYIKSRGRDTSAIAPLECDGYLGLTWMAGRRLVLPRGGSRMMFTRRA